MASTLVEYEKLTNDPVVPGIAQTIYHEAPWLSELPFKGITSNTLKYKVAEDEAGIGVYEVGEEWTEETPTWEDRYADLAILGGDADVDEFIKSTMGAQEPIEAEIIVLKSQALARRFMQLAILGRTTATTKFSNSKNFKGLLRLIAEFESATTTDLDGFVDGATGNNDQVLVGAASASAQVTLDHLDTLVDLVKPKATHIITSRMMRNKISSLARAAGNNLRHDEDKLGMPVTFWGDYKLIIDDAVPNNMPDASSSVTGIATYDTTTTRAGGNDITPIFAVYMKENGLCGITSAQNGMIQTKDIGTLPNKDAERTRIKFYCGLAAFSKKCAAVYISLSKDA